VRSVHQNPINIFNSLGKKKCKDTLKFSTFGIQKIFILAKIEKESLAL